jgi:hypothetical protein
MKKEGLLITKGGRLMRSHWSNGKYNLKDVTGRAPQLLFEACELERGLKLRDVLILLNRHIDFFSVFLGNWCREFVTEGLSPVKNTKSEEAEETIKELELYFRIGSSVDGTWGFLRPDFHGLGRVFKKPTAYYGMNYKKGDRIEFSVLFVKTNELANLPLKLNREMVIYDENLKSKNWGSEILRVPAIEYSLSQILNGILWELSFSGSPKSRDKHADDLKAISKSVTDGTAKLIPAKDVFKAIRARMKKRKKSLRK